MVELRQFEYFVAVAEERHFTRAANRLHVAQSGLSATIKGLEAEVGAALLRRTTRRVELTAAGEAFLTEARRTLAAARAAVDAVSAVEGLQRGTLAVGVMQAMSVVGLAGLLATYRDRYPGVELRLRQAGSADLVRLVAGGVVDLAFTSMPDPLPDGLVSVPLLRSPIVLVCPSGDPLASAAAVDLAALAGRPQVGFPPDWGARMVVDAALAAHGLDGHLPLEVNDTGTLLDLVEAGLGVALVPAAMADLRPSLHQATFDGGRWSWTVSIASAPPAPANPAGRALWAMLA
ncbi:MAG: LysR family transcriptional regulator [Acidimicrobiales bacterium]